MGDLYHRVRLLPERIAKARKRIAKLNYDLMTANCKHACKIKRSIINAEQRLRALENEARQFNFFDLLS